MEQYSLYCHVWIPLPNIMYVRFIPVVICGNSLFPWNILLYDYITISSTVDGHLVCLQFCTVMSGAVMNIIAICFLVNMHVHFCVLCAKEWNYWVIKYARVQLW